MYIWIISDKFLRLVICIFFLLSLTLNIYFLTLFSEPSAKAWPDTITKPWHANKMNVKTTNSINSVHSYTHFSSFSLSFSPHSLYSVFFLGTLRRFVCTQEAKLTSACYDNFDLCPSSAASVENNQTTLTHSLSRLLHFYFSIKCIWNIYFFLLLLVELRT